MAAEVVLVAEVAVVGGGGVQRRGGQAEEACLGRTERWEAEACLGALGPWGQGGGEGVE